MDRKKPRDLPWRRTRDPYAVWVPESCSSRPGGNSHPFYGVFWSAFPTLSLAAASSDEVLKVWENLATTPGPEPPRSGEDHGEPARGPASGNAEDLAALPGIGEYTAGAVGSIAFGRPVPAVDGNVRRVLARLYAIGDSVESGPGKSRLRALAAELVLPGGPRAFNQSLRTWGPGSVRQPCPLSRMPMRMSARPSTRVARKVPVRRRKSPASESLSQPFSSTGTAALVVRRPLQGFLGGLWKFPGVSSALEGHPRAPANRPGRDGSRRVLMNWPR